MAPSSLVTQIFTKLSCPQIFEGSTWRNNFFFFKYFRPDRRHFSSLVTTTSLPINIFQYINPSFLWLYIWTHIQDKWFFTPVFVVIFYRLSYAFFILVFLAWYMRSSPYYVIIEISTRRRTYGACDRRRNGTPNTKFVPSSVFPWTGQNCENSFPRPYWCRPLCKIPKREWKSFMDPILGSSYPPCLSLVIVFVLVCFESSWKGEIRFDLQRFEFMTEKITGSRSKLINVEMPPVNLPLY